eukprot:TRINITY_DN15882_c0_g2_i1.p1 TRINITY_DN15882_c0_g2~~TRINITY_DN15882_c0_g2_i1.p1  ORF type:complete len:1101 (+),score=323.12 TRINITY_DN15882_c0_g2_i1:93-3305(+)
MPLQQRMWRSDSARDRCAACAALFTALRRRHHCRSCGDLFCAQCSAQRRRLPRSMGWGDSPQRVCLACGFAPRAAAAVCEALAQLRLMLEEQERRGQLLLQAQGGLARAAATLLPRGPSRPSRSPVRDMASILGAKSMAQIAAVVEELVHRTPRVSQPGSRAPSCPCPPPALGGAAGSEGGGCDADSAAGAEGAARDFARLFARQCTAALAGRRRRSGGGVEFSGAEAAQLVAARFPSVGTVEAAAVLLERVRRQGAIEALYPEAPLGCSFEPCARTLWRLDSFGELALGDWDAPHGAPICVGEVVVAVGSGAPGAEGCVVARDGDDAMMVLFEGEKTPVSVAAGDLRRSPALLLAAGLPATQRGGWADWAGVPRAVCDAAAAFAHWHAVQRSAAQGAADNPDSDPGDPAVGLAAEWFAARLDVAPGAAYRFGEALRRARLITVSHPGRGSWAGCEAFSGQNAAARCGVCPRAARELTASRAAAHALDLAAAPTPFSTGSAVCVRREAAVGRRYAGREGVVEQLLADSAVLLRFPNGKDGELWAFPASAVSGSPAALFAALRADPDVLQAAALRDPAALPLCTHFAAACAAFLSRDRRSGLRTVRDVFTVDDAVGWLVASFPTLGTDGALVFLRFALARGLFAPADGGGGAALSKSVRYRLCPSVVESLCPPPPAAGRPLGGCALVAAAEAALCPSGAPAAAAAAAAAAGWTPPPVVHSGVSGASSTARRASVLDRRVTPQGATPTRNPPPRLPPSSAPARPHPPSPTADSPAAAVPCAPPLHRPPSPPSPAARIPAGGPAPRGRSPGLRSSSLPSSPRLAALLSPGGAPEDPQQQRLIALRASHSNVRGRRTSSARRPPQHPDGTGGGGGRADGPGEGLLLMRSELLRRWTLWRFALRGGHLERRAPEAVVCASSAGVHGEGVFRLRCCPTGRREAAVWTQPATFVREGDVVAVLPPPDSGAPDAGFLFVRRGYEPPGYIRCRYLCFPAAHQPPLDSVPLESGQSAELGGSPPREQDVAEAVGRDPAPGEWQAPFSVRCRGGGRLLLSAATEQEAREWLLALRQPVDTP